MTQVRHLNPELYIVARADSAEILQVLHEHGVQEVVQPEFEASLEMARQALLHLDIPPTEIQNLRIRFVSDCMRPFTWDITIKTRIPSSVLRRPPRVVFC